MNWLKTELLDALAVEEANPFAQQFYMAARETRTPITTNDTAVLRVCGK